MHDSILPVETYLRSKKKDFKVQEHHHPSSARVAIGDKIVCGVGGCLRAQYWNWMGVEPTNPINLNGLHNVTIGHAYEDWYEEGLKILGKEYQREVAFKADIGLKYQMSGRIDFLVKEDNGWEGVELKTSYGRGMDYYKKTKKPKESYLLQMLCYFEYLEKPIKVFHNPVFARDNFYRTTFKIEKGKTEYTFKQIVASWRELEGFLERKELPPRDFNDKDYQCRYCAYKNKCNKEVRK